MKKILIFALLLVFAAFPVFAQVSIGGELDFYMFNGFENDDYKGKIDKAEINFSVDAGDFNSISAEIEGSFGNLRHKPTVIMNYMLVETDWVAMFGGKGFSIVTSVGFNSFGTFDNVSFTGYDYEDADNAGNIETGNSPGFMVNVSFLEGLIQPYYTMSWDTDKYKSGTPSGEVAAVKEDGGLSWIVGLGIDFSGLVNLPLWIEAYYGDRNNAHPNRNDTGDDLAGYQFGVEAAYNFESDSFGFDVGGFFQLDEDMVQDKAKFSYGAGIGFDIVGFGIGASFKGHIGDKETYIASEAFSVLGVNADYFFLDWLGVNAGVSFSFKKDTDVFQTIEAGVILDASDSISYRLGYIYYADDWNGDSRSVILKDDAEGKGSGIYFSAIVGF